MIEIPSVREAKTIKSIRNEWKYRVDEGTLVLLEHRLQGLLRRDSHQKGDSYRIRSMYFDDPRSNGLFQNEEGEDHRLKLRIRFYDLNTDYLLLEVKEKVHGFTVKDGCRLSMEQFERIMAGIPPRVDRDTPRPLALLGIRMRTEQLRPVVIVEYFRSAYTYPGGNTRVTFDRNIAGSLELDRFLEPRLSLRPILPPGQHLIEVKFDDRMPGEAAQLMDIGRLYRTAFSKYALCRQALLDQGAFPLTLVWPGIKKKEGFTVL